MRSLIQIYLHCMVYNYHHQRGVQISQVSATDRTKREQIIYLFTPCIFSST